MSAKKITNLNAASVNTFAEALVFNAIVAGVEIVLFTLIRGYFPLIYEPRSFSISKGKRQQPLSPRLLGWITSIFNADLNNIREINGLDCYFFVRFLRMMVRVMLPIWLLSWAVLIPLSTVKTKVDDHSGLDKLIFGNIATNRQSRYAGHVLLAWLFTMWIWYNIKSEMKHYVRVRQDYLVSHAHSSTAQACSVLVTGIPPEYLSELTLTRLFDQLPGGVRQVWINRDLKDMPGLYDRRLKACDVLESAGTSLLNTARKRSQMKQKDAIKDSNNEKSSPRDPEVPRMGLLEELVPRQDRPSHRLPLFSWLPFSIPFVGKRVDAIEWASEQVHELTRQLEERREILSRDIAQTTAAEAETTIRAHYIGAGKLNIVLPSVPASVPLIGTNPVVFSNQTYPPANAAFILFNKQIAAHIAAQALTHDEPYCMSASQKYIEVAPEDVIWKNLTISQYDRRIRFTVSWAITIGLILLWSIPVTFIGIVSDVYGMCYTFNSLAWVCNLPDLVVNLVQGVLATVLLQILFYFVPIMMRALARFEGIPQMTGVELSLMDRFFLFQVIVGFFVVTFSTDIVAFLYDLSHLTNVPRNLAENMPDSSTFFLTFVVLQGLSGTAQGFSQIMPLLMYYIKIILFASTPRSVYEIKYSPRTSEWGTLFPKITQLVVITLGYSIISPVINGLAFMAFFLFYFLYKYHFTWVNDQPPSSDTGGLFLPRAINHIFVGLYIQQLCLCALFFLSQDEKNRPRAIPEGVLMVVLIVFTAFFHDTIRNSYGPLIKALPLTGAFRSYNRVGPENPTAADMQKSIHSSDVRDIDYTDVSAPFPDQLVSKGGPPLRDDTNTSLRKRVTDHSGPSACSPSPLAKLVDGEGRTDFKHPVTMGDMRVVWLPKDTLGLVKEIERDLDSQGILYSTEGTEMDAKGKVDVILVSENVSDIPKEL